MTNHKTIGQLFDNPPATWGFRGDPHLWQAMQRHFSATQLSVNSDDLVDQIKKVFRLLTQHSIDENEIIVVKEFAHGGMSSGGISVGFWRERALPLLLARFEKLDDKCIKVTLLHAIFLIKISGIEPETAKFEAQLLLQHVLNVNRAWLIAHENDALQPNIHAVFEALLQRRLNGEPIAYILGYREFYGLKLNVTPDTLIPRPDTETVVEAALAKIPHDQPCKILDLGTGTGAIALAIAKHRPQAFIYAADASQAALDVATENAGSLEITNIKFILGDWFSNLNDEKFDVIVSNPPYIVQDDIHLQQGDLRFEPISALAAGQDGLDAIRKIISQAPQHLNPHGWLMLEHGFNQAHSVADFLMQAGFSEISHVQDLAGILRVTLACYNQASYLAPSRA